MMDHRNVREFRLGGFVGDDSPNAMGMIMKDDHGEEFMITTSLAIAGQMSVQIEAALKQLAKDGHVVSVPSVPERIVRYNAVAMHTDEGPAVEVLMEGDRSNPLHGIMTQTDARRLSALLSIAAESSGPKRAN